MRKEESTNFENEQTLNNYCSANKNLSLISGRWKLSILFSLFEKDMLYHEFKEIIPNITDQALSKQLNELQKDGIITKQKTKTSSTYQLTPQGRNIEKLLLELANFKL